MRADTVQDIVYQDSILTLRWHAGLRYHIARWEGFGRGEVLRTALRACMEASGERVSDKWLADVREFAPVAQDDQPFFAEEVFPTLARNGIRYFAVISPRSVVAAMSTESIVESFAEGDIVFAHFNDEAEAMQWLASADRQLDEAP